jgi:putative ABC transport system ATP-binding protein
MIIEARNLSKKVIFNDKEITILDDINLKVSSASSLAVIGPSGSGKSTLLGILAGLDSPSSGEIYINQKPLHDLSEDARSKIRKDSVAFVFQNFELLSGLNALENVMLPLELKDKKMPEILLKHILKK